MVKGLESFAIASKDAKKLANFYQEKVGLKTTLEAEVGEKGEELYGFEFPQGSGFYIMDHSEIKGQNKEPKRIIFNLEVDDIEGDFKKLVDAGVKKIADIYHMQDYGYIATFEDIDGNYFQLVQTKAS